MPIFQAAALTDLARKIFQAAGAPPKAAQRVSESLVGANLAGIDSHGVVRVAQYVGFIQKGELDPKAGPTVVVDHPSLAMVDGHHGFGQVIAVYGIEIAMEKARSTGIGVVGLRRTHHIGRVGEYVLKAAEAKMVGVGFCNGCTPNVAPFGAIQRVFGTNPIACAAPSRDGNPILIDLATSLATEGKVRVARNTGQRLEKETAINRRGEETTSPDDFYDGGALLPIGRHKGSALSLMIEILGGFLTGAGSPAFADRDIGNGVLFIVLDPKIFREGLDPFLDDMERMQKAIKKAERAKGVEEVLLPGEPEFRSERIRRETGIPLDEKTWAELRDLAERLGVSQP
ncbi:MAG: Ldh family oxidoreductase [Deltaproteobacteria bacterium]|nr:Ldh family oxidoreductase [Deltaproteobacteria bacterium]MBI4223346.1 Ldh family oxidoreductase [Deltaproteobacteria bacterium]